jgi:hypothetical protein
VTIVLVNGCLLTSANIGDSAAVLDTGCSLLELTDSHRIQDHVKEKARLLAAGCNLAQVCSHSGVRLGTGVFTKRDVTWCRCIHTAGTGLTFHTAGHHLAHTCSHSRMEHESVNSAIPSALKGGGMHGGSFLLRGLSP